MSVHHGEQELTWPFAAGLFLLVLVAIALMFGAGFALAWLAGAVA